jgi:hypothetical protein
MPAPLLTLDLSTVIRQKTRPGITLWNRLEGRPRATNFERALRAEVRDPLWMLCRQWQVGEFQGDDAGSPVEARVHLETTRLRRYQPADAAAEPFDDNTPLEARVEALPLAFDQRQAPLGVLSTLKLALDLRLLMGRQWLKVIGRVSAVAVPQFIGAYPIAPADPLQPADLPITAHPEAWSTLSAVAGRRMDGAALYKHLKGGGKASDGIAALAGLDATVDPIATRWMRWFEKLIHQPGADSAWESERLEYRFATSTPVGDAEKVMVAEQYHHGHLDWYNFDVDADRNSLGEGAPPPESAIATTLTMLPTQATFNGMPNSRWWKFEDGRTNFGDVKPDTTDLAKLLLIEFGLVYANDWFLVPFTAPAGSLATVRGVAVSNVFGERTWIEAAGRGDDENWQRWAMFLNSIVGDEHRPADLSLMLPPAAQKVQEGAPMEEVLLVRDEMANMVWGIERVITLTSGEPKRGREAATELRHAWERDLERRLGKPPEPLPPAEGAKIRYRVMTSVPENWIPMVPVHVDGSNREVQLQRGAMLRIMTGDPSPTPDPVRPRTWLLRPGLEEAPATGYIVHEEEVTRAGTRVTLSYQRTRWRDGQVWVWLGARKLTGRGEGSSGLAFDQIIDMPAKG